jgi:hypothetical protein
VGTKIFIRKVIRGHLAGGWKILAQTTVVAKLGGGKLIRFGGNV